jgi:4-carboxymuconolactone decarboxylase
MSKEKKLDELIGKARKLMEEDELAEALASLIEHQRGGVGFVLGMLKRRPKVFNPFVLKGLNLYKDPHALDRKTAELVAVSAAAALRCEHCVEAHMGQAVKAGASLDELLDTILISGAISDSATLSVAMRKFKQLEGKTRKSG